MRIRIERNLVAYSIVATVGMVLLHGLSMLLRKSFAPEAPAIAYPLVWSFLALMVVSMMANRTVRSWQFQTLVTGGAAVLAVIGLTLFDGSYLMPSMALLMVGPLAGIAGSGIARRLPLWMDGALSKSPVRSILWALVALVMVVQTARLSSWVTDPSQEHWLTTDHPLFAGHMCMVAYVYAADLNRQGVANVYDTDHYPGLNPEASVNTTVKHFSPDDPYQYPPQFLLLPRLAIELTDDFELIKIFWLLAQMLFFGFIAWSVARYVGGETGLIAALLIPLLYISFPVLSNMQYGQFHLMSILLGVAGMMWFAQGRIAIGGASLAFAMLSKMAPGILLIYLIARRRWKEIGWTLGFCAVYTLIAIAVLGTGPFEAFFAYQVPNLSSGAAFAFAEVWPELTDIIVAGNQSPFAFIHKLQMLGIPGMTGSLASITHLVYTVAVLAMAFVAARIKSNGYRQVLVWLALLNLAAMVSKGAWGDYIPIGTIWLLTFMIKDLTATVPQRVLLGVVGLFMFLSLGVLPLPGLGNPDVFISLAAIGTVITVGFNVWVLLKQRAKPAIAPIESPSDPRRD